MNLLCRSTVSRLGNSSAVVIPKKVLASLNIALKSKIDVFETEDGILLKPVAEWSAERQTAIISDIVSFVQSPEDNEIIPDDFLDTYCRDNNEEDLNFEHLRGTNSKEAE